jgi:plastocyanin domain-containing protein
MHPFLPAAAALALFAAPALAQHGGHDHGSMPMSMQHGESSGTASAIAEGTVKNGVRTVTIAVTDSGFEPAKVKALKGEKVRLVVTRKTNSTCAKEIVVKDFGVNQPLPLDKAVTVEFTPAKSGEIRFACAMGHVSGVVFVP